MFLCLVADYKAGKLSSPSPVCLSQVQQRAGFFRDALQRRFSETYTNAQLARAIDWGRYTELYSFDADRDEFVLENSGRSSA